MSDFKQYRRKQIAELRPVTKKDIENFDRDGVLKFTSDLGWCAISISELDLKNGSPEIGDMIARNPNNHLDQWLVAEEYFKDNFEEVK